MNEYPKEQPGLNELPGMWDKSDLVGGETDTTDYETWVREGFRLFNRHLGSDEGLKAWHEWSRTAHNYDACALDAKWNSFRSFSEKHTSMDGVAVSVEAPQAHAYERHKSTTIVPMTPHYAEQAKKEVPTDVLMGSKFIPKEEFEQFNVWLESKGQSRITSFTTRAEYELKKVESENPVAMTQPAPVAAVRWEICRHCGHDMKEPCHHNDNPNAAKNCHWNQERTRVLGTGLVNNRPDSNPAPVAVDERDGSVGTTLGEALADTSQTWFAETQSDLMRWIDAYAHDYDEHGKLAITRLDVEREIRAALQSARSGQDCAHRFVVFGDQQPRPRCIDCNELKPLDGGDAGGEVTLWRDVQDGEIVLVGDRILSNGKAWAILDAGQTHIVGRPFNSNHWRPVQRAATTPQPAAVSAEGVGEERVLSMKPSEWQELSPSAQAKLMQITGAIPRSVMLDRARAAEKVRNTPLLAAAPAATVQAGQGVMDALIGMLDAFTNPESGEVDRRLAIKDARAALAASKEGQSHE